jgi:hypothetical protein
MPYRSFSEGRSAGVFSALSETGAPLSTLTPLFLAALQYFAKIPKAVLLALKGRAGKALALKQQVFPGGFRIFCIC